MVLNTAVKAIKREAHRGSQAVTTDQITTDIIACINDAIRDVIKLIPKRFWFKQSTVSVTVGVAGTPATYSLASDVQEPINFWYNSNGSKTVLKKIDSDKEWIEQVYDPNEAVGKPKYYREIGPNTSTGYKQIEIFPISDGSYTVNYEYYKTKGTDLTTSDLNSEITILPDYTHDVLWKGGLYYFLHGFDDPAQGRAKADYDAAAMALEIADERDKDSDLRLRFGRVGNLAPHFRLQ